MKPSKNNKTLYLHAGFHKTATSSFQLTCFENRHQLARQAILYPDLSNSKNSQDNPSNHSIPILLALATNPDSYPNNLKSQLMSHWEFKKYYLENITKTLETNSNILLSGEDISALNEQDLRTLKKLIASKNFNLKAVAVVRSPYDFACSVTQESINNGLIRIDLNSSSIDKRSHYIKKLMTVFGQDINFFPFSNARDHKLGPNAFLAEKLGIDTHDFRIKMEPSNAGKNNLYTRTQNILNTKEGGLKLLLQSNPSLFSVCDDSQKFMFTKKELSAKEEGITQENNLIRDILGSKFCDTSINTCSEIDTQEVAKIIAKIIETLQKR